MDPFLNELHLIVDTARWGTLETTSFDMPVMMVSKPEWLKKLHERVVRRTVRFLNRKYAAEKTWSLDRFYGRRLTFAKKDLRAYGTPLVGMNFNPHITLRVIPTALPVA